MRSGKKKSKSVITNPLPATQIKAVAVLEADEESTDLLPPDSIRSEVNFLNYPFFALSRKDAKTRMKTEYYATVKRGEERLDASWVVSANPRYGYPRPFDGQVHKAIEYIISRMKTPVENPVRIGSLLNLAKLIGISLSRNRTLPGKSYKEIQDSLIRIVATTVESKGTFYDKGKERWIKDVFHLYDRVVFTGQKLPNGEIADSNYVLLSSWYLENINARYVKPLDYTYYRSLKSPIASRLYELLGVKFYSGNPYIRYKYSNLCKLLPVTQYQHVSKAQEILNPVHQELINTGFLYKAEWEAVPNEPHDWYVSYYPGTRAKEEIQRFSKQALYQNGTEQEGLPPPDDSGQTTPHPTQVPPSQQVDDDVINALLNFGITKRTAQRLTKKYPQGHVLQKLDMVKWLIDTNSLLVKKNPQGFLVKAIEDGYLSEPPKGYKASKAQEEQQQQAREEYQYRKTKQAARQRLSGQHPPQPIAGTEHTTESAWSKVLASLREQVSDGTYKGWLKDTLLLKLEKDTAYVAYVSVTSRLAREYLERRLYQSITRTLEQVLGKPVEVEFVVSEPSS